MDKIFTLFKLQNTLQPIDIIVQSGATVCYVVTDYAQTDIAEQLMNTAYKVTLLEASKFELLIVLTQVKNCMVNIELDLQGLDSRADVTVLYSLSGQQNLKINTIQKHQGKKTVSNFIVRGIVTGQAQVSYQGLISLQPSSKQADAKQEHTTIVLSKQAKVVSIPSIEVLHHDVQCSHGAAIGQFHEQQLWYLQSRGFEKRNAYKMLVCSFFAEYVHQFLLPYCSQASHRATSDSDATEFSDKNLFSNQLLESLCQKIL